MKRFWKRAESVAHGRAWTIELDGKPVRTPARTLLELPSGPLAADIAQEWNGVGEEFDPRALPLTGLANAAIDRVAPAREAFYTGLAAYAEGDLACYRAESPKELVARQKEKWDSLLAWARRRYDVDFCTTSGIVHVDQPGPTIERLTYALAVLDPFQLAGMSPLITIGGSLLAALAVLENALSPEEAWDTVTVDDRWQLEQWGSDAEAEAALANRRRDFLAAARFLALLS